MNEKFEQIQNTEKEIKRLQAKLKELKGEGVTCGIAQYSEQRNGVFIKIKYIDEWMGGHKRNTSIYRCNTKEEAISWLSSAINNLTELLHELEK